MAYNMLVEAFLEDMGKPEDFESSQLLLLVVARAPLAVYKYLSLLPFFLFLISHPLFGVYQKGM